MIDSMRAERDAEHAADVLEYRAGRKRPERDDLRDRILPVFLPDILDHLLTLVVGEVDVDVGHADPVGVQEALEEEIVLERVDIGDAEGIRHDAPGSAPPARDPRTHPWPVRHG